MLVSPGRVHVFIICSRVIWPSTPNMLPKKNMNLNLQHPKTSTLFYFQRFFSPGTFTRTICWYIFVKGRRDHQPNGSCMNLVLGPSFAINVYKCIGTVPRIPWEVAAKNGPKIPHRGLDWCFSCFFPPGSRTLGRWGAMFFLWGELSIFEVFDFAKKKVKEDTCLWTNSFCPTGRIHFNTDILPMLPYMCSNYICNWYHWTDSLLECEVKGFLFVGPKNHLKNSTCCCWFGPLSPEILGEFPFFGGLQP